MQVALSIFSPTSATRKIKTQFIPLQSPACTAASKFYQLVAAAWSREQSASPTAALEVLGTGVF